MSASIKSQKLRDRLRKKLQEKKSSVSFSETNKAGESTGSIQKSDGAGNIPKTDEAGSVKRADIFGSVKKLDVSDSIKKAPTKPAKICAMAISCDEEHVIERCLQNIQPVSDMMVISFNGSGSKTKEIFDTFVQRHEIPHSFQYEKWVNFGHNRNHALKLATDLIQKVDSKEQFEWYLMPFDLDDMLEYESSLKVKVKEKEVESPISIGKEFKAQLGADAYKINTLCGTINYETLFLIHYDRKGEKKWSWKKVLHEYLGQDGKWEADFGPIFPKILKESRREGKRSMDPLKYLRDMHIFETEIARGNGDDRDYYYRAQSCKDAAQCCNDPILQKELYQQADRYFIIRIEDPRWRHWNDEYTYLACVEAVKIRQLLQFWKNAPHHEMIARLRKTAEKAKKDDREHITTNISKIEDQKYYPTEEDHKIIELLQIAIEKRPWRFEAPYYLIRIWAAQKKYNLAWALARMVISSSQEHKTPDQTFIDEDIHQWNLFHEAALCAFYAGDKGSFRELSQRVISCARTPDDIRKLVRDNLQKYG